MTSNGKAVASLPPPMISLHYFKDINILTIVLFVIML